MLCILSTSASVLESGGIDTARRPSSGASSAPALQRPAFACPAPCSTYRPPAARLPPPRARGFWPRWAQRRCWGSGHVCRHLNQAALAFSPTCCSNTSSTPSPHKPAALSLQRLLAPVPPPTSSLPAPPTPACCRRHVSVVPPCSSSTLHPPPHRSPLFLLPVSAVYNGAARTSLRMFLRNSP